AGCRYLRVRIFCGGRMGLVPKGILAMIRRREPIEVMRPLMCRFKPSMIAATAITDVTPITMPSTVSADRALRVRSVSSATERFSKISRSRSTLVRPQCDHWIEARRPYRRVDSEEDPDGRAQHNPEQRHPDLHRRRKGGERAQSQRTAEADRDADQPARHALQYTLCQK